ncbi:hypothetical protein CHUAL_011305 [Chamberlinius hualienensis]
MGQEKPQLIWTQMTEQRFFKKFEFIYKVDEKKKEEFVDLVSAFMYKLEAFEYDITSKPKILKMYIEILELLKENSNFLLDFNRFLPDPSVLRYPLEYVIEMVPIEK